MTFRPSALVEPAWEPDPQLSQRCRLGRLMARNAVADVAELCDMADRDPEWFWQAIAEELGVFWQTPPSRYCPGSEPGSAWFDGGECNIVDTALWRQLERDPQRVLLAWLDTEEGSTITAQQLADEVVRVSAGLRDLGLRPGDRVGLQLPPGPESVIGLLATAQIGAVAVPMFSGTGPEGSAQRLRIASCRCLVTVDAYERRGQRVDALTLARESRLRAPDLEWLVVVQRTTSRLRSDEVAWSALDGVDGHVARLAADSPLMIGFSSGTSGPPKGAVLTHAGFMLKAGSDVALLFDAGVEDRVAWITDPGWIMGPITTLGGLVAGSSIGLLGGTVDHPGRDQLWRFANDLGISVLGLSPTVLRMLASLWGSEAVPRLQQVRVLASSGEPLTEDAFSFGFHRLGRGRLPIINYSGGTEVSGAILSNTVTEPVMPSGFATAVPGMGAAILNGRGEIVDGGVGELVLRNASPGMARSFWGRPNLMAETYYGRYPGLWWHGDLVRRTERAWYVQGRSDDVLNLAGKRMGPSEIEDILNSLGVVAESAAVGAPDPVKGERLVVFIDPSGDADADAVEVETRAAIRRELGAAFEPSEVFLRSPLPKNPSGKILRRDLREHLVAGIPREGAS